MTAVPLPGKPDQPPSGYKYKPDGSLAFIPGGPADPSGKEPGTKEFKPTEFQSKSAGFLGRMLRADKAWAGIDAQDKGPRGIVRQWFHEKHPDIENTFMNNELRQKADQNVQDFISATLRQESGAAINAGEFDRQFRIFFPMPGDGPKVLKQKAEARAQAIAGFRVAAGPLGDQVVAEMPELGGAEAPTPSAQPNAPAPAAGPPALNLDPNGNVILQDRGRGTAEGSDTGLIGLKGGEHTEADPNLAGVNAQLNAILKKNAPDSAIVALLQSRGQSAPYIHDILRQARAVRQWQKQNPGYKGDFNVDIERSQVPNSAMQNFANSDVGVAGASAADAATGFNADSIIGALGGDAEGIRQAQAATQAAHPKSAAAGTIAGGVGSAIALENVLGKLGLTGLAKPTVADLAYGANAGAGATDYAQDGSPATAADRLGGAAKGALAATAGGLVGQGIAATGRGLAKGARDPYVASVNAEGVPTTVGQQYTGKLGGIIKRTEDRIAGLPVVGDIINARRLEGIKKWNEKVFDRTLEPIGVKSAGKVGEAGIDHAQDKISEAFNKALGGKAVVPDAPMAAELTKSVSGVMALPRVGDEVADGVRVILEPYMSGPNLSGEAMQQISRELRDLKASYNGDPLKKRIGEAIDEVEDSIFGPFRRQLPDLLPEYDKAKLAQRRLYIVADAVNAAKNKEGVFMPSQLGNADRSSTKKLQGKVAAARGKGQFHDMQRAAQQVLPGQIPDSGTAGRIIVPGIALGVGSGSDAGGLTPAGTGTALAGILALAYTRSGQRFLTKPGRGIGGRTGKALQSDKTRKLLTAGGATVGTGLATQQ